MKEKEEEDVLLVPQSNKRAEANIITKKWFCYLDQFFSRGWSHGIDEHDISLPAPKAASAVLTEKLERFWREEEQKDKPKLWRALMRAFLPEVIGKASGIWISEFVRFFQAFILAWLIGAFQQGDTTWQYIWAGVFGASSMLWALSYHSAFVVCQRSGAYMRIALCSLMYRRLLKFDHNAIQKRSKGQVINLMSNDVMRFDLMFLFLNFLLIAPCQCIAILIYAWPIYGVSVVAGLAVIALLATLQGSQSRIFARLRQATAKKSDVRIKLIDEMINSMKTVKMYVWEGHFASLIAKSRKTEINKIWNTQMMRGLLTSIFTSGAKLIIFPTILILMHNTKAVEFNAQNIFFLIALLNVVRTSCVIFLPLQVIFTTEACVSIDRIQQFLLDSALNEQKHDDGDELGTVKLDTVSMGWGDDILRDVSLTINPGQLVVLSGPVGAGKTSFLALLLGELSPRDGKLGVNGTLSYCSQDAWIFLGSIRQNVLFGREYDAQRYARVIKTAQLNSDLALFQQGDKTIVGDKGATLSGGQRARINLARCLYRDADIYLIDDPFAAVDPSVAKKISHGLVKFLSGKTKVIVTHQSEYLADADQFYLVKDAQITQLDHPENDVELEAAVSPSEVKLIDSHVDLTPKSGTKPQETVERGKLGGAIYATYFSLAAPLIATFGCVAFELVAVGVIFFSDVVLKFWINEVEQFVDSCNVTINGTSECDEIDLMSVPRSSMYKWIFISVNCVIPFLCAASRISFFRLMVGSNRMLHDKMINKIMSTGISFFESTSPGVIMNRFSKDIGQVDDMLPMSASDTLSIAVQSLVILALSVYTNYYLIIVSVPLIVFFYYLRCYYVKTAMQLKRYEGSFRSPLVQTIQASIDGLTTIRANEAQEQMIAEFDQRQDRHSGAWMLFLETGRWLAFRLDIANAAYITTVAVMTPLMAQYAGMSASDIGLSLTTCVQLLGMLQWGIRQSTETENLMTSVERLMEYTRLEDEVKTGNKDPSWPKDNSITFKDVHFSYNGVDDVLRNININIAPNEKIGIVGRTGAGKSSLTTALFRLRELRKGEILIGNHDIRQLNLDTLRNGITVIPQEPTLFSVTIRANLDPYERYSDAECWHALDTVQLKAKIEALGEKLDFKVTSGGGNFSIGERQLFCLARALLKKSKVLIVDEATANVDPATDDIIQEILRNRFGHCTTLTIAHRLNTIIDSSKILVLDKGEKIEFDTPRNLLSDVNSHFYRMAAETSILDELKLKAN